LIEKMKALVREKDSCVQDPETVIISIRAQSFQLLEGIRDAYFAETD
jgi:hypothetical protein